MDVVIFRLSVNLFFDTEKVLTLHTRIFLSVKQMRRLIKAYNINIRN